MAKLLSGTTIYGTTNALLVGVSGNNYVTIQGANTGNVGIIAQGSETNVPLVLAPKGSGAIQAQFTDNTTVGGSVRGAYAVDLQTLRFASNQIASGQYAFLGSGQGNRSAGFAGSVVGGQQNIVNSNYGFIGAGAGNLVSGDWAASIAGLNNNALGVYNLIGGGHLNSGTLNTPFATLNSTIASNNTSTIYFTAPNTNVKYGQYIAATGLSSTTSNNYVSSATFAIVTGTTASAATGFIGNGANTANGNIFTANNVTGNLIPGMVLTGANILGLPPGTSNTYIVSNNTVTFTSTISGNVLTVTSPTGNVSQGMLLYNGTITPSNTYITAQNTGSLANVITATFTAASGNTNITLSAFTANTIANVSTGLFVNAISGIISTNTYVTSVNTANSGISISKPLLGAIAQSVSLYNPGGAGTYDLNQVATGTPTTGISYTVNQSQFVAPNLITGTPYTLTLTGNQSVPANTIFSFYTPHGVVVGGGNNVANGAYSFVGAGGDGGNSNNGNKATGDYSVIVGGAANRATAIGSFIGGGGVTVNSISPNQATGNYAVVVGGYNNVASASGGFIGSGRGHVASGQNFTVVVGGDSNQSTSYYSATVGGNLNVNNSQYGFIGGGSYNSANNHTSFVGTGYNNSAGSTGTGSLLISTTIAVTSSTTLYLQQPYSTIRAGMYFSGFVGTGAIYSYVTQPVTTGTPAVMAGSTISGTTLTVGSVTSGTIVPGMMVTGTGIVGVCYIVSGAGLTWTINATQTVSSATTLTGNLYTITVFPAMSATAGLGIYVLTAHATIVGGGNNVANGSYSFIGGGGDAGNANNRNISSGDWSVVVGGIKNTANGIGSFVGGGGYHVGGSINGNFAGGSSSAIVGGFGNSTGITTQEAFIGGGYQNQITAGTQSAIVAGANQLVSSFYSFIGSGINNTVNGNKSSVVGGDYNTAAGIYNFIGGGSNNSGTLAASATTATTTIANTSSTVYISGANANIKVGQQFGGYSSQGSLPNPPYITSTVTANGLSLGTGATITSNTLTVGTGSQVGTANLVGYTLSGPTYTGNVYVISYVSGSGDGSTWTTNTTTASAATSANSYSFTLSNTTSVLAGAGLQFYTPHGVVVGGGNNIANGAYSFVGGGGDAGTPSNRNLVAQDFSSIVGGRANQIQANATGTGFHFIGGGDGNIISIANAHAVIAGGTGNFINASRGGVLGGITNSVTAIQGAVLGGSNNLASGLNSAVIGGSFGTTRAIVGNIVSPACSIPIANLQGASQAAMLVLGRQTTDATATALASDANAAGTTNQVILPNNSAYFFRGEVIAGVTGGGDTKGWTIEGVIKRGAGVGTTALVGSPTVTSSFADAGASTWTIAVTADTTNGGLRVTFTGQAATTIRVVAQLRTTEMTF